MSVCGQISECVSEYCDSGDCVGAGVMTMVKVVPVVMEGSACHRSVCII